MSRAPLQRGSPSEAIVEAARAAMNTTFFSAFPVQVRDRSHVGTADSPFMLVTVCGLRVWLRVLVWPSCVAVYVAAYIAVYMCGWLYLRLLNLLCAAFFCRFGATSACLSFVRRSCC